MTRAPYKFPTSRVYRAVVKLLSEGRMPTVKLVGDEVGIPSTSSSIHAIRRLEKTGLVKIIQDADHSNLNIWPPDVLSAVELACQAIMADPDHPDRARFLAEFLIFKRTVMIPRHEDPQEHDTLVDHEAYLNGIWARGDWWTIRTIVDEIASNSEAYLLRELPEDAKKAYEEGAALVTVAIFIEPEDSEYPGMISTAVTSWERSDHGHR